MNAKERLDTFYSGGKTDILPNLTIVGSVVTQYTGINLEVYSKDARKMADSAIEAAHDLSLDFVQIASDLCREAEGYGSEILFPEHQLPTVKKPAIDDIHKVSDLNVRKVSDIPRLGELVDATEYVLKKEPEIYPMTLAVGPMSVAGNVRGVSEIMIDSVKEPEAVDELLEKITETTLDYIHELAAVGAKYMYVADPTASLMGPAYYRKHILPLHKKIFQAMKDNGIGASLHMCGNTQKILPISCECGAAVIDVDCQTDFVQALKDVDGRAVLNGNINPVADVYECDAQHTKQAILDVAEKSKGYRAMFMPGCELPTDTKLENVKAIHEALAEISGWEN